MEDRSGVHYILVLLLLTHTLEIYALLIEKPEKRLICVFDM